MSWLTYITITTTRVCSRPPSSFAFANTCW